MRRAPFAAWVPLAFLAHVALVHVLGALASMRSEALASTKRAAEVAPIEVTVDAEIAANDRSNDQPGSFHTQPGSIEKARAKAARAGTAPSHAPDPAAAMHPDGADGETVPATGDAPADDAPIAVPRGPLTLGLGAGSRGGGVDLNLRAGDIEAVVGKGEIERAAKADSDRRLAAHRDVFAGTNPAQYKEALEHYVPAVKIGNQRPLGVAQIPFGKYIKELAERIKPIFVEDFVVWLRTLPSDHPMRRPHQFTRVEIVIDQKTGALVRSGVVLTSGITAFDVAVLHALKRAAPFGAAPEAIASGDGRVYVQWDLYNDEYAACTAGNARPSIVKTLESAAAAAP